MTAITELPEPTPGVVPNDIHRRFVRAAVYSGVLGGVSQALYGVTPMIDARKLGPLEYGVYSVVMSLSAPTEMILPLRSAIDLRSGLPIST